MGIPLEDTTLIYCDNQLVVMNANLLDFTFKKKINSIPYQFVYYGSAKYEWICGRVVAHENPSYLMIK